MQTIDTMTTPNYDAIKTKQNATWASGDYSKIGSSIQLSGELLAETLDLTPGTRVLDVAAGNGNITLAMARRGCEVTSTDYVEALLDRSRQRAQAEGLEVEYQKADAENLPFEDGTFEAVVSTFGVMFTPDQAKSASEMQRVCKSGGHIGMANWTPESFIGRLFAVIGKHVPPPAGVSSPALWGTRDWLATHFDSASNIAIEARDFIFRYRSPKHFVDFFRAFYGPTQKAFEAVGAGGEAALEADILALIDDCNTATDGTMRVPSAYLEVVVTKG